MAMAPTLSRSIRPWKNWRGVDEHKARVVELRFFGGLTVEQTAAALGVSASTVARDWQFARLWLHRELSGEGSK